MSYPPAPPPAAEPAPAKQSNGFAVAALVLGLIGLIVFSWIPGINLLTAIPIGILAIIFGIIAIVKSKSRGGKGKGMGLAGLILGVLAIAAAIVMNVVLVDAVKEQCEDPNSEIYGSTQCEDIQNM
ncbi:DUF4190 domain-containing protein [Glycomyces sp. TRM65418]|uniref:DUF4190 domain-containing protein n=1 Tax=Glycomyces sp. TRM65418 TaxID=2867006 RepID=UPI001CE6EDED|nr:DUF4190 domain-containing protein [Glycomyces sp. TRM65418]MCC3762880.1 DUF4190 domain-containing protein [Glycomyces sp. TRM65418]QZD56906.1 DUF4190 domain-containing protein [Glycomyces sp. TRM65418]